MFQNKEFLLNEKELFERGLREMGYRLYPEKIEYTLYNNVIKIQTKWVNRAVGRAQQDFILHLILADNEGKIIKTLDAGKTGSDSWVKGKEYKYNKTIEIPEFDAGTKIKIGIGLYSEKNKKYMGLPVKLKKIAENPVYHIGDLTAGS